MDALNRWFEDQTSTPVGSILLFLLVFLSRLAIDQWQRRRADHKASSKRKGTAHG